MPTMLHVAVLAGLLCIAPVGPPSVQAAASIDPEATREELEQQKGAIERHLLRVQQQRFEARARGEDPRSLKRLEREFKRTYGRRNAVIDELKKKATE